MNIKITLLLGLPFFAFKAAGQDYQVPYTEWGVPNFQSVWKHTSIMPFERPRGLGEKRFYTEEEARVANVGHIVTRALGTRAEIEVETAQHELQRDDVLLLCSDGLSDMVADWSIEETLKERGEDLQATASKLVDLANRNGGKDNISVILMQVYDTKD